jgi:hypothetical protein
MAGTLAFVAMAVRYVIIMCTTVAVSIVVVAFIKIDIGSLHY